MKEIPLTHGLVALVDDEDFEWLSQWRWAARKGRNTFYAMRQVGKYPFDKNVHMHREIMQTPNGMVTDHIDKNGCNNQRSNLRVCTDTQNKANRGKQCNNTSGFKGVTWNKYEGRWVSKIEVSGKTLSLGYFSDPEIAARAYDEAAKKYHGEFANLNFGGND